MSDEVKIELDTKEAGHKEYYRNIIRIEKSGETYNAFMVLQGAVWTETGVRCLPCCDRIYLGKFDKEDFDAIYTMFLHGCDEIAVIM